MHLRSLLIGFFLSGAVLLLVLLPRHPEAGPTQRGGDASVFPAAAEALLPPQEPSPPVRLRVPALGIDAPVEPVGLTRAGAMDIPASAFSVGWYAHGGRPGETGAAVLAGHRDTAWGAPGVFWALRDVEPGDALLVELDAGEVLQYRVERLEQYPYDDAPMEEIFGATAEASLRLITCAGAWNTTTYDRRLVVYARLRSGAESPFLD